MKALKVLKVVGVHGLEVFFNSPTDAAGLQAKIESKQKPGSYPQT